jgi:hypothetical protein
LYRTQHADNVTWLWLLQADDDSTGPDRLPVGPPEPNEDKTLKKVARRCGTPKLTNAIRAIVKTRIIPRNHQ